MPAVSVDEAKNIISGDMKFARAEYTRMRDIAEKRIKRMGKSEFAYTRTYQEHKEGFAKLRDLSPEQFAKAYSELSKFVNAKSSSITGQRDIMNKTIKTWNEQGIPLTKETYKRTISILENMRRRKIVYGSDTAQELAKITLELTDRQFTDVLRDLELYLTHTDELSSFLQSRRDARRGFQRVRLDDFKNELGW